MTRKRRQGFGSHSSDNLILKTDYIAGQLGLSVSDFERYRHLGMIVASVDCGVDGQTGISRVKCRLGNRVWEALVNEEGTVVHETTTFLRGKLARPKPDRQLSSLKTNTLSLWFGICFRAQASPCSRRPVWNRVEQGVSRNANCDLSIDPATAGIPE
ncbi:DUF6522 family protein [Sinorhizobium garamanticum]|uniref:DUF6522 family protein n=1 Tax=Sinorhizobium garamanticum TaxID=680247 RepID=A0ABY8DJ58_9HYPH|nr:DUF6522 family protein [Sinorhizobium garamanticum]WEX90939.1 DUF6522 family protein [Sinorhizobium garamanticum]